jgi:serine/threonine protein kinase/Tol biopolymer transport system component
MMTFSAGTHLGPYEILSPLGAGGMGEVWKARDTRLGRTVAIKISAAQFSQRFEREARAIAALNHPHICTLYDVGPDYLVMEYIEGQPLRGPLPLDKTIEYAKQILDALDAAHRRGIVHRDLKPGNILVSRSGIKLLDFGLAKAEPPQVAAGADAATIEETLTHEGAIAGTLPYMAPEQLQGGRADARADIFAFGCVFYEMLTGKRAFEGQSAASVMAAVLERGAPSISGVAPAPLEIVLTGCLTKDPEERWQSARDVRRALGLAMAGGAAPARSRWRGWKAWIAAAVCLVITLFISVRLPRTPESSPNLVRFPVYPPENSVFSGPANVSVAQHQFALSPNGRAIVFVATVAGSRPMLWVRALEEIEARLLPGTEDAEYPFWSADSGWLGFFSEGKVKKVRASGGPVQVVAEDFPDPRGGSWSPDDTILLGTGDSSIYRVPPGGGAVATATRLNAARKEGSHRWPHFLPDGRHFLFTVRTAESGLRSVFVGSLDGDTTKLLIHADSNAQHVLPGYLLFLDGNTLLGQAFDATRLELSGQPFTIAGRVGRSSNGYGSFSASRADALAYAGADLQSGRLIWFDRGGKPLGSVGPEGYYTDFRLSPDEKRLAVSLADARTGYPTIWLTDLSRGSLSRFTLGPVVNSAPVWSPDGTRIAFRTMRGGLAEFYEKSASGGGKEEPLLLHDALHAAGMHSSNLYISDWSSDGRYLLCSVAPSSGTELWLLPLADRKPVQLLRTSGAAAQASFSPDGRFLAYASDESGRLEVYVQTFPLSNRKWPVSTGGGSEPRWRADGREIYYLSENRKLMAAAVGPGPSFDVPKPLFQTRAVTGSTGFRMHYVPSRDGRRFLVNTQSGDTAPTSITVELNWRVKEMISRPPINLSKSRR